MPVRAVCVSDVYSSAWTVVGVLVRWRRDLEHSDGWPGMGTGADDGGPSQPRPTPKFQLRLKACWHFL